MLPWKSAEVCAGCGLRVYYGGLAEEFGASPVTVETETAEGSHCDEYCNTHPVRIKVTCPACQYYWFEKPHRPQGME